MVFGAGKIGRSFIGQLFGVSDYEVIFVDIYKELIDELNKRKSYKVIIKSEIEQEILVQNVRGIHLGDVQEIIEELVSVDIAAVSVGQQGFEVLFPILAQGIERRWLENKSFPLDLILAENLRNASEFFEENLRKLLPENFPIKTFVGFVETSIGKMVPIMRKEDLEKDILQVFAEPYNTLILDKKGFRNPIPDVRGLAPKDNMKAWVDRKSFIHNLGHAAVSYLGYLDNPAYEFLYEALAKNELRNEVRETMLEAADILMAEYPDEFTIIDLTNHIDDLLFRFSNKYLGDTIFRVGCDLYRKLSLHDRLAGAIVVARKHGKDYKLIIKSLVSGFYFRAMGSDGKPFEKDKAFVKDFEKGIEYLMVNVCGFNPIMDNDLINEAYSISKEVENRYDLNRKII